MILCIWLLAVVVSLAPAFGLKDEQFELRITQSGECLLSQDVYYQVLATCTTFYVPLIATLIFYWKIYQVSNDDDDDDDVKISKPFFLLLEYNKCRELFYTF